MPSILTLPVDIQKYVIYGVRLWNDDQYRYVGYTTVGTLSRSIEHMKDAKKYRTPFYNWYRKYAGRVQIVMEVIEICPDGDVSWLKTREMFWIATYRDQFSMGIRSKPLLNLSAGGDGFNGVRGKDHPNYGRIGWNRGIPMSDEQKKHLSLLKTGVSVHSDQQKEIWSEVRSGVGNPMFGLYGEAHPAYGYSVTGEEKIRRSIRLSGELNPMFGKPSWNKGLSGDKVMSGENHGMSKLKTDEVKEIRCRYDNGDRPVDISKDFGVTTSTVCKIGKRQTWKHIK